MILISGILLLACGDQTKNDQPLPYYSDAFFTPQWFPSSRAVPNTFHKVRPFNLINQEGASINLETFRDKIYVADFFFASCPGICPTMTKNMSLIQEAFMNDPEVLLLSHSVTPNYDSISVLKAYAQSKGIVSGKWHLATGDREEIYDLGRNYYFAEEDLGLEKSPEDFLHTENFLLIDKNQHVRGIYNGLNQASIDQLIADIYRLKKES